MLGKMWEDKVLSNVNAFLSQESGKEALKSESDPNMAYEKGYVPRITDPKFDRFLDMVLGPMGTSDTYRMFVDALKAAHTADDDVWL